MKKPNKEKSNDIIKLFLTLFIIIIISLAFGYFLRSTSKPKLQTEYSNGFTFTKVGNFWYTTIKNPIVNQEYNIDFRYAPSQVRNIIVTGNPDNFFVLLKQGNLTASYITFDLDNNVSSAVTLAAADLSKLLKVINGITLVAACTSNQTTACYERPIVTCENQEDRALVIYLKQSTAPRISMTKNCLTIEGENEDLVRAYTKLLFLWYNIL